MKKIEKYYESTADANPNYIVKKFIELKIEPGNAVELGCGAGRDTIYLIKNGWNVLAIDREDIEPRIKTKLSKEESKQFKFLRQKFEKIELEKNNLVIANFSLPFCNKNNFKELWNKINDSILKDGYFVGNFFGDNDGINLIVYHHGKDKLKKSEVRSANSEAQKSMCSAFRLRPPTGGSDFLLFYFLIINYYYIVFCIFLILIYLAFNST